jgi:hypothetical protein
MESRKVWLLAVIALGSGVLGLPAQADDAAAAPKADTSQSKAYAKHTPASQAAPAGCLQATGTRIPLKAGQCAAVPGRIWARDDVDATGAATTAQAARLLGLR